MTVRPRRPLALSLAALAVVSALPPSPGSIAPAAVDAVSVEGTTAAARETATSDVPSATTSDASVAASMAAALLARLNRDRAARGLRPLRSETRHVRTATERAGRMAATGTLSHSIGGDLGTELTSAGIRWFQYGEDIGTVGAAWGAPAADMLYDLWRASPAHWSAMMSDRFAYVGIGVARRTTDGTTWASLVFTESPDVTPPVTRMTSARAVVTSAGTAAVYAWRGADPLLQTHTAGFRDFDVAYRVDAGSWRVIRAASTTTSMTLALRPHGHSYWVRVRGRDRAGNVSAWSPAVRVVVP